MEKALLQLSQKNPHFDVVDENENESGGRLDVYMNSALLVHYNQANLHTHQASLYFHVNL